MWQHFYVSIMIVLSIILTVTGILKKQQQIIAIITCHIHIFC